MEKCLAVARLALMIAKENGQHPQTCRKVREPGQECDCWLVHVEAVIGLLDSRERPFRCYCGFGTDSAQEYYAHLAATGGRVGFCSEEWRLPPGAKEILV